MANPPGTRIDIVVCQKHGLRYNRAVDTGCAFCRRDGEVAEPSAPRPAAPPSRPRPSVAASPQPAAAPPRPTIVSPPVSAAAAPRPAASIPRAPAPPATGEGLPDIDAAVAPPEPPESRTPTGSRALDVVTCEKHGLRYNRAAEKGCARCRSEAGTGSSGVRRAATASAPKVDAPASLPMQLLFAALLVGGTGTLFWSAHQAVLESFAGGVLATAGSAGAEAAAAPGDASYEAPDPNAWPPPRPTGTQPEPPAGMRGRGPAEQQKQVEELFRQMKEDAAKERGEAPDPGTDQPQ
ncbi:MAG TPA: hypothetical protein VFS60_17950 [Thermoanaerobaculia bacterium]|nr:hypothetical protein [Thermoanaerobaculia bacterium]